MSRAAGTIRHLLTVQDLSSEDLHVLVDHAAAVKSAPARVANALDGRSIALIFEQPSTRTLVSFEVGIASMGGHAVSLKSSDIQLGRGETISDTGRVLSRYVDAIVVRAPDHDMLEALADAADVPVVNALTRRAHPCQALGDLVTIKEHLGRLEGVTMAYVGDSNNVAHSLMVAGALTGMHVRVASPSGFLPRQDVVEFCRAAAGDHGGSLTITDVVTDAVDGAGVLYTDAWVSMGDEAEATARARAMQRFQLNSSLLVMARDDALVMHCLPAHRGQEITDELLDGPHSVVWDQAENRLHAQKALLDWLLN